MAEYDVIVVGAGNAALAAAVTVRSEHADARHVAAPVLEQARGRSNYPGGTGLMSGAVFGRLAGAEAAAGA
jgi:succinate dehydrogenase/fumarate reductase flavoprotein subunit